MHPKRFVGLNRNEGKSRAGQKKPSFLSDVLPCTLYLQNVNITHFLEVNRKIDKTLNMFTLSYNLFKCSRDVHLGEGDALVLFI